MSKKDDRIAELEAENAKLQEEVARLKDESPDNFLFPTYYLPALSSTTRCGLCGQFLSDGYGPAHQCWQWTCTSDRTVGIKTWVEVGG